MSAADHLADFSTTDDALVLASVSSKAEFDLLNDWLQAQRRAHPETTVEVFAVATQRPVAGVGRRTRRQAGTQPRIAPSSRCGCSDTGGLPTG